MGKVRIENCTKDTRTLIAPLKSGARVVLTILPGDFSDPYDEEVIAILRENKAVEHLFRGKLVRVVPAEKLPSTPKPKVEAKPKGLTPKEKLKTEEESKFRSKIKKEGKVEAPKKLDLGV